MNGMFAIFDFLVLAIGVYLLYAWYLLKYKGEVKENILLAKEYPFKKCKDKGGYVKYMAPRVLAIAIASILSGGGGLINDYLNFMGSTYIFVAGIFFVVVIWFAMAIRKCYKLFW